MVEFAFAMRLHHIINSQIYEDFDVNLGDESLI